MQDSLALSYAVPMVTEEVTIELDGRTSTVAYSAGDTLLQTARMVGLNPPSSCEVGSCGTCMARLTEGCARMINNDAWRTTKWRQDGS